MGVSRVFDPVTGAPQPLDSDQGHRTRRLARTRPLLGACVVVLVAIAALAACGSSGGQFVPFGVSVFHSLKDVVDHVCRPLPTQKRFIHDDEQSGDWYYVPFPSSNDEYTAGWKPSTDDERNMFASFGVDPWERWYPNSLAGDVFKVSGQQYVLSITSWTQDNGDDGNPTIDLVSQCPVGEPHNPVHGFVLMCGPGLSFNGCYSTDRSTTISSPHTTVATSPTTTNTPTTAPEPTTESTSTTVQSTSSPTAGRTGGGDACTESAVRAAQEPGGSPPDIDPSQTVSKVVCGYGWAAVFIDTPTKYVDFLRDADGQWQGGQHASTSVPPSQTELETVVCHGVPPDLLTEIFNIPALGSC